LNFLPPKTQKFEQTALLKDIGERYLLKAGLKNFHKPFVQIVTQKKEINKYIISNLWNILNTTKNMEISC
jgi:hypothetical protein